MRQTAARLNRAWLTVIGVILLLAGLLTVVIGSGLLAPTTRAVGVKLDGPTPSDRLFATATTSVLSLSWVVVVMAAIGVVLALLGLAWLGAQIPRSNEAKPFRLHDEAETGLTRCAPSVLTDAVEAQIEALPGVQAASGVLRGTAQRPDLTVRVTASDRSDVPALLQTLQNEVAVDFGQAFDTQLYRLGVQIEIDTVKSRSDRITL